MSSNFKDNILITVGLKNEVSKGATAVTQDLSKLEGQFNSTLTSSQKFDAGLKAFSWTTFAQGALNTSTALAQLYTSISNIARVQHTVKTAMIGIERAEDLMARKTLQLNKEIERNGILSEKAILLRSELATATEDLTAKQDRLALAQDQVNDTYILFTSNVVNTVFGSLQTLVGMYTSLRLKKLADAAATGVNTGSTVLNTTTVQQNTAAKVQNYAVTLTGAPAFATAAATNTAFTGSVIANTVAVNANKLSLMTHPFFIAAAVAAAVAGMALYMKHQQDMTVALHEQTAALGTSSEAVTTYNSNFSSSNSIQIGNYSSAIKSTTDSIDELTKKIAEAKAEMQSRRTTGIGIFLEWLSPINPQLEKDVERYNREIDQINLDMQAKALHMKRTEMAKSIALGDIGKFMSGSSTEDNTMRIEMDKILKDAESMFSSIKQWMDDYKSSYVDATNAIIERQGTVLGGYELEVDEVKKLIDWTKKREEAEEDLGKTQKIRNEQEIRYLKEIAELKKKTSLRYLQGLDKDLFESVSGGKFGLSTEYLETIVGSRAKNLGYQPFSGYINKRLKEVDQAFELIAIDNKLEGQVSLLEEMIMILPGLDPKTEGAKIKQILEAMGSIRSEIATTKSGRVIVGGGIGAKFLVESSRYWANKLTGYGQNSAAWKRLEQEQLKHQKQYGPKVPRRQVNVDFRAMVAGVDATLSPMQQAIQAFNLMNSSINSSNGNSNRNPYGNFANAGFASGRPSGGQVTPQWVRDEIKLKDAYANSLEGWTQTSLQSLYLYGYMIPMSRSVSNAVNKRGSPFQGIDVYSIGLAGALNLPADLENPQIAERTAKESLSAYTNNMRFDILKYITEEFMVANLNPQRGSRTKPFSNAIVYIDNTISRFKSGNYGDFDVSLMVAILGGALPQSHVPKLQSEYNHEKEIFNTRIAPILNIHHGEFLNTLTDSRRGINEIDDRIRWKQRLEQISTGATIF